MLNSIPAQEIKRRGIAAIDDVIERGDVHIIRNNRPQYVVISQERYQALLEAQQEAYEARVLASLAEYQAGGARRGTAAELIAELGLED